MIMPRKNTLNPNVCKGYGTETLLKCEIHENQFHLVVKTLHKVAKDTV